MKIVFSILRFLPLCFLKAFFSFAMLVVYIVLTKRRKIAQNNIKFAIGRNYRRITLKTYLYFGKIMALNIKYLGNRNFIRKHFKITGIDNYIYAKSFNKGIIFTTAHFGNWEMMVCAFAILVEPINIMVRPLDNEYIDRIVEDIRSSCGNKVLSSRMSAFSFIKLLKKGESLGILIDQAGGDGSIKVDFFKRRAKVSESIALFSLKLGVPIVPAYLKECEDGFEIVVEKPIIAKKGGELKKGMEEIMQNVYSRFENWIRKEPEKYLWMHNRWK